MSRTPKESIANAVSAGGTLLVAAVAVGVLAIAGEIWPLLYVAGAVAVAGLVWLGFGLVARAVELGIRASED